MRLYIRGWIIYAVADPRFSALVRRPFEADHLPLVNPLDSSWFKNNYFKDM